MKRILEDLYFNEIFPNASDYNENPRQKKNLKIVEENEKKCRLRICVSDNGIGITREQQQKLFTAFEQADSGTSRKYGGTGLGLAISKRIVEMMDGTIWVESDIDRGSKFYIEINVEKSIKKDETTQHEIVEENINTEPADTAELSGNNILVAEDVEINREIIIALLEETGVNIDLAENGKEAVNMVKAQPEKYDIVFMDMRMPEMDGLEATRQIRTLPPRNREKLPIIAMTANVFRDDVDACIEAGMDDHIGKPIDLERVMEVIRKYCTQAS